MSNIALNYSGQTGDLDLVGHRLKLVTGEAAIEQNVKIRLRFLEGSWFLDEALGIPYIGTILIKNPDTLLVESIFREAILGTAGIQSVNTLDVHGLQSSLPSQGLAASAVRKLSVTFTATMDTGQVLTFEPFIIKI